MKIDFDIWTEKNDYLIDLEVIPHENLRYDVPTLRYTCMVQTPLMSKYFERMLWGYCNTIATYPAALKSFEAAAGCRFLNTFELNEWLKCEIAIRYDKLMKSEIKDKIGKIRKLVRISKQLNHKKALT